MQIIFLPTICSPPEKLNAGTCWTGTYIPFMPKYEVTRWKFSSFWFWELVPCGRCFENLSNLKGEGVPKPSLIICTVLVLHTSPLFTQVLAFLIPSYPIPSSCAPYYRTVGATSIRRWISLCWWVQESNSKESNPPLQFDIHVKIF